jgi:thioredoxin reductase
VDAQDLDRIVVRRTEPVRQSRVELGDFAGPHRDVVLAEDQSHLPGQDVQPLVAVVRPKLTLPFRRNDDLPHVHATRLLCQRKDHSAVADARLEPNSRIADVGCADELVERHLMDFGQREEQLEAGLPLAALQPGQRALGDPGLRGERGQGDAPAQTQPFQARTDFGQDIRDGRRLRHDGHATGRSQKQQRKLRPPTLACTVECMDSKSYDVVVIGGGAAGLSAALVLGRARRRVAVVDGGTPRNAPAAHMQGFLSRDGTPPADLLAAARAELRRYAVELVDDRVVEITKGFTLRLAGGRTVSARRLLLASGAVDELPDIPGARERWGRDFLHCPYCHGWEVRDQPIGVLGTGPGSVDHAQLLRQWSDDIIFFAHTCSVTASERAALDARGIPVIEGRVARFSVVDDHLNAVQLIDGRAIPRAAVFVRPNLHPRNDGLIGFLGCEVDQGGFVRVDGTGRTSVFGVWAAGNVANPRAQVITAAGEGSAAAIAINADLVEEDVRNARRSLTASRASGDAANHETEGNP